MIQDSSLSLKDITFKIFLFCCTLIASYVFFLGIVSIWVGFHHPHRHGHWMPVAAGALVVFVILFLFLKLSKFFLKAVKEKDY